MGAPTFIDIWDSNLEPDICRDIIRRFEEDTENQFDGVVASSDGTVGVDPIKQCTELFLTGHKDWADIDKILYERVGPILNQLTDMYPGFGLGTHFEDEGYRIKRYLANGEDSFAGHSDVGNSKNAHRQLVFMWYLNDVHEGGETYFPYHNMGVQPKEGRLVTFPPFWTHFHEGRKPVSNAKYVILGWMTLPKLPEPNVNRVNINHE